jgi:hypothetical protein
MPRALLVGACLVLGFGAGALVGCDGDDGGPGDGGAGGTVGGAGGGGGGVGGGGGGAGGGGAGGGGGAAQSVLPSGTVCLCIGDCPMGECDDDLFFADVACSTVYSGPVSPSSTYCNAGQTGVYCLRIRRGADFQFGITCTNGTAFGRMCSSLCGVSDNTTLTCD